MKKGDLVKVYGYDSRGDHWGDPRGDHPEDHRTIGILMGWDESDQGWILLRNGQLQVFAKTWWRCEVINETA